MIASRAKAVVMGAARLVVDGTDETLTGQVTIALSPGRAATRRLDHLEQGARDAYNGALQHRRDAWHLAKASISRIDQFNEIPGLFEVLPAYARYGTQWVRGSMAKADEAFAAFFGRCRAGETPGYPRFKSKNRFRSIHHAAPMGWKLKGFSVTSGPCRLYVQGVGDLGLSTSPARQIGRYLDRGGEPRCLVITRTKSGALRATITMRGVAPRRLEPSSEVGGVDRGISVTAALPDGTLLGMPAFVREPASQIADPQRLRATHRVGSKEWRKLNRAIAKSFHRAKCRSGPPRRPRHS